MNEMCITVREMGKRLSISKSAAYNLVNMERFYPAFRIGKRVLVNVEALERWMSEQTEGR